MNDNTLLILLNLAQEASHEAAKNLAHVRLTKTKIAQQIKLLENYRAEYNEILNQNLHQGISHDKLQNYHQFLTILEIAINYQKDQLTLWSQYINEANLYWQKKQQRVNAFKILIQRAKQKKNKYLNDLEQKQIDEFALKAALRRTQ
ncbi:flagellar export protein FliJ [Providencia sneebia]|uniref:Flagellar FliJ protein n=1 Tax=Providencia sneebia DSM 19967 TaxID=1141660 RepID=K8WF71_9GAMM|nr:flagellar export protein FliJ [Providencia sneebia]EKT58576.1 flagellar biosynthesis chaperone [Providencia sneebia DSM 19967]